MAKKLSDHEKEKGYYFVSVTHDLDLAQEMIKSMPEFQYWAYIYHEPDTDEGTPHYHFLVHKNGSRSVKQVADVLGISSQYVQVCNKVVAFRRYMLHLDSEDKKKYNVEDVHSSDIEGFKVSIQGEVSQDIFTLYRSYNSLFQGKMTPEEFIQLNYSEITRMSWQSKIKMFQIINSTYGGGASSPPTSRSFGRARELPDSSRATYHVQGLTDNN